MEQKRVLRNHSDQLGQIVVRDVFDVHPVDSDRALVGVVKPGCQVADCRFSGTARADERGEFACARDK